MNTGRISPRPCQPDFTKPAEVLYAVDMIVSESNFIIAINILIWQDISEGNYGFFIIFEKNTAHYRA